MARISQHSLPLPPLLSELSRPPVRPAGPVVCVARGIAAAVIGCGALAVLVILLWVGSPYPDSGLPGAFHVAAALWLLGHGAGLVRADTLSGAPAPVGLVPLLLLAGPVWLVFRAARGAAGRGAGLPHGGSAAWWGVTLGYLLVGAGIVAYARDGALRPQWQGVLVRPPLLVLGAALAGAWRGYGARGTWRRLRRVLPARLIAPGAAGTRRTALVAARAGLAGTLVLVGGGAVLAGISLVWHGAPARASFAQLTNGFSGRLSVLLLAVTLIPNAAVWAAAYALGPGFPLGAGRTVAPYGVEPAPSLPPFPLLAMVPGDTSWAGLAALSVPLAAGVAVACFVAAGVRGARRAFLAAPAAALVCGVLVALLAWFAGGPLGVAVLADFGPVWWQAGGAALGWVALVGTAGVALALVPWVSAAQLLHHRPRLPRFTRQPPPPPPVEPYDFLTDPPDPLFDTPTPDTTPSAATASTAPNENENTQPPPPEPTTPPKTPEEAPDELTPPEERLNNPTALP